MNIYSLRSWLYILYTKKTTNILHILKQPRKKFYIKHHDNRLKPLPYIMTTADEQYRFCTQKNQFIKQAGWVENNDTTHIYHRTANDIAVMGFVGDATLIFC